MDAGELLRTGALRKIVSRFYLRRTDRLETDLKPLVVARVNAPCLE